MSATADASDRLVGLLAEAKHRRRDLRDLPAVVRAAVAVVLAAARRPWLTSVGVQVVQGVLAAGLVVASERLISGLVDAEAADGSATTSAIVGPAVAVVLITLATGLLTVWATQLNRLVSTLVERSTWGRVLDVSQSVDLETFESPAFFDQLRRIEANTLVRPHTICTGLGSLVGGAAGAVALSATIVRLEPLLLPLLVASGAPLLLLNRASGRLEFDFAIRSTPGLRLRRYLREVLIGRNEAKELRSFAATAPLRAHYDGSYDEWIGELRGHMRSRLRLGLLGGTVTSAATVITLVAVLVLVASDRAGLAEAGAALVAVRLLASRVQELAGAVGMLFESALFMTDLEEFELVGRATAPADGAEREPFRGIALRDVSYRYPGADRLALDAVDLDIAPGEVVALVGENGSGKTTLAKLVAQLYRPTSGAVLWGDRPAPWSTAGARRREVSVVFQDFVRFGLSARRNIGLGDGDLEPDTARVHQAGTRAGADPFLQALPSGYDTLLGKEFDGGVDLSVGQWQRIALARAFYRDAPLVVLDEPTSALDVRAEHDLFVRVRELFAGRAVLLVTHRLASVRHADRIYVLSGGRIVEQGDHHDLVASGGVYDELYRLQASAFT